MTIPKPIIVLDIDGVLFQTPTDAVSTANSRNGTSHHVADIFNHNAEHDQDLFVIDSVDQFWHYQHQIELYQPVPGSKEALERLNKVAQIIALTSRNYDDFAVGTRAAIIQHFGDLIGQVHFTTEPGAAAHREKGEMVVELGGVLLVDDAVKYCESATRSGITGILFSQPYNQSGHDYPAELTAEDWPSAVKLIEKTLAR